jgi:hypothetical protein
MAWLPVSAPSALTNGMVAMLRQQLLRAEPGERVLDMHGAAQSHDVGRRCSRG